QDSARNRSGGMVVTIVTTRPMNQGTALSVSATRNSMMNSATNSALACRPKCHRNAASPGGGSGFCGTAVGLMYRSSQLNMDKGWLQGVVPPRQPDEMCF